MTSADLKLDLKRLAAILDDSPETDEEKLRPSLRSLANRLAALIPYLPPSSPLLLSGDWGSGKTSLLRLLRKELDSSHPTVWFEAWRYEDEGFLLAPLLRSVWEGLPEEYRHKEQRKEKFRELLGIVGSLSLRGLPAALGAAGLPVLASAFQGLNLGAAHLDQEAITSIRRSVQPLANDTDLLISRFHSLIDDAWSNEESKQLPLIIFIDDLDRCHPAGALDLLDAIRSLLTAVSSEVRVRFVVALDKGVLASAVEKKLQVTDAQEGNRFLEKMFPLAFDLPKLTPEDVTDLVEHFLGLRKGFLDDLLQSAAARGTDDLRKSEYHDALSHTLSNPNFANPRLMKRCIHRFFLVVNFEGFKPVSFGADGPEQARQDRFLAQWIAACEKWPLLRRRFNAEDSGYWHTLRTDLERTNENGGRVETVLREFVELPGLVTWMQREMLANSDQVRLYEQAESRLRRWGL